MQAPITKLAARVSQLCKRDLGIFVPAMQKVVDPIQQLFVDKIREYKSKSTGGKLVDPSPEFEAQVKNERERVAKQFGMKPGEANKFPSFNFAEPKLEFPGVKAEK